MKSGSLFFGGLGRSLGPETRGLQRLEFCDKLPTNELHGETATSLKAIAFEHIGDNVVSE